MAKGPVIALAPSKSHPDSPYEIRLGKDNVVYCSCWPWKKSPAPKNCDHLRDLRAQLAGRVA